MWIVRLWFAWNGQAQKFTKIQKKNQTITKKTPIQIYGKFHVQKTENFQIKKKLIFFIFLLKTWIVGTR